MNLSVSAVAKFIILVYFLAMPFTHAYALHRWLPLPLLVLLVGMFFLFILVVKEIFGVS